MALRIDNVIHAREYKRHRRCRFARRHRLYRGPKLALHAFRPPCDFRGTASIAFLVEADAIFS
jgi:hypothetical protein